jgi:histidinol-phosphate/aromatic aminotransferase/cobyric acid decarboxylase-like protein
VALRQAIGKRFDLDPDRIVCGAGSDELISLLIGAYAGPGDEVLYSQYGFLMYAISAKAAGATPVAAPEKNLTADVDALLEHVTENTRMLFLANAVPGQPEQPDRHLPAGLGTEPPARQSARRRAAGDRRGLCRICRCGGL